MYFYRKISILRFIFWICLIFGGSALEGTTFVAVPLETQVRNAGGVVWGKFQGAASKKISGVIVTEATFELSAVSGITPSDIVNKNNFKIIYPGGTWQGITYKTLGTPEFVKGEEVVLFVTKGRHGYGLVNLGLSKYVVERGRDRDTGEEEVFFKNSIFGPHHGLGRISLERLNGLLEDKFRQPFTRVVRDKYAYPKGRLHKRYVGKSGSLEERKRKPASMDSLESGGKKMSYQGIIWIILIFSILGGYFAMVKRSE